MPSSPSRPPAAEEASYAELSDGEVPPRQAAVAVGGGAANRASLGSAGEEEEEIYDDDDESSDYNSSSDGESDESVSYYEDGEEEEEEEGPGGDKASGSAEEEAASAGVGGGPKAEGSPRAAATCCICMDPWASYGAHRICCIPCGHVYGRSCLERWLRRGGNTTAKCPQCGGRFKHRHIINLYSPAHLWNDCCLKEAYVKYVELLRLELRQHIQRVQANEDYNRRMITVMVEAMQKGVVPTPIGPQPPPAGPYPYLPTFEEWVALGCGTPGIGGSSVGGATATPGSQSPHTPFYLGGAAAGASAGGAYNGGASDGHGGA